MVPWAHCGNCTQAKMATHGFVQDSVQSRCLALTGPHIYSSSIILSILLCYMHSSPSPPLHCELLDVKDNISVLSGMPSSPHGVTVRHMGSFSGGYQKGPHSDPPEWPVKCVYSFPYTVPFI